MNAPVALSKSVLNDYVPKAHRAKWAATESINTSTWAGSAALGGLLSDHIGYRHTFLITAGLQTLGMLLYVPLAMIVEPEAESAPKPARRAASRAAAAAPLAAPLLAGDVVVDTTRQ